jgi:hypothetical protein
MTFTITKDDITYYYTASALFGEVDVIVPNVITRSENDNREINFGELENSIHSLTLEELVEYLADRDLLTDTPIKGSDGKVSFLMYPRELGCVVVLKLIDDSTSIILDIDDVVVDRKSVLKISQAVVSKTKVLTDFANRKMTEV